MMKSNTDEGTKSMTKATEEEILVVTRHSSGEELRLYSWTIDTGKIPKRYGHFSGRIFFGREKFTTYQVREMEQEAETFARRQGIPFKYITYIYNGMSYKK